MSDELGQTSGVTGDWLSRFSDELAARLRNGEVFAPVGREKNRLLEVARDVAHSTERKNAPLAAFIVGRYVECRAEQGVDVATAVEEAAQIARGLLPSEES